MIGKSRRMKVRTADYIPPKIPGSIEAPGLQLSRHGSIILIGSPTERFRHRMIRTKVALFALLALGTHMPASDNPPLAGASPVLVELFTSEGCSSCPPADALLQKLDRDQPVSGTQVIVLSEHVDYWNHLGWKDPYSSRFFSDRQNSYGRHFGLNSVYTPQMVVDGAAELTGSDSHRASAANETASHLQKIPIRISVLSLKAPDTLSLHVEAGPLAASSARKNGEVYVAVALNRAESEVAAGENGGRHLSHTAVVQSLTKVGLLENGKGFARDLQIPLQPRTDATNLRVIAFVQESESGHVLGATMQRVGQ